MGRKNLDLGRRIFQVVMSMDLDPANSDGYHLSQFDGKRPEASEQDIRDLDGRILGVAAWIRESKESNCVKCMYFPLIDRENRPAYVDRDPIVDSYYPRRRNIHTTAGDEEAASRHGSRRYSSVDAVGFD